MDPTILYGINPQSGLPIPIAVDSFGRIIITNSGDIAFVDAGGGPNDAYRIQDGIVELFNPTTGLWYPLSVTGAAGHEQLVIGQGQT